MKTKHYEMPKTTIIILFRGDRSVGIPDGHVVVQFNHDVLFNSPVMRASIREKMKNNFVEFCEGEPEVHFGDECPNCGQVMQIPIATVTHKPGCECAECITHLKDVDYGKLVCVNKDCLANYRAE